MGTNTSKTTKVTSPSQWKKGLNEGAPLTLPSGNVAKVRRISLQTYLKTGRIPNLLMAPVQKALQTGKGEQAPDIDFNQLMQDPRALTELFRMVDMVTIDAFLEPKVAAEPEEGVARDDDTLYVDEIDVDDKMFVFQWMVGGTSDLEQFRNEQKQQLGSVPAS